MKLAIKLTIAITTGILVVLASNAAFRVQREIALFESDSRHDGQLLGRTLAGAVARIWSVVGEQQALDLVEDANQRESTVRIRWIWLDAADSEPGAPTIPPTELAPLGRGTEVAVRINNEAPTPSGLYTYIPVSVTVPRAGAIEVHDTLSNEREYVRRTIFQALIATTALVIICGTMTIGLGYVLVGKPVAALIDQSRRVGQGDLSRRSFLRQNDEIGQLGREMNTMCDLLAGANEDAAREAAEKIAALEQLRHADRLSTVGELAAGLAHELGTPLSVVTGRAQLISRDHPSGSETYKSAAVVLEQSARMTAIIQQLLDFARRREARKTSTQVRDIVAQTVGMLSTLATSRSVAIDTDGDEGVRARVDAGQLQQALTNLVVNAIQAMPEGGRVRISWGLERLTPDRVDENDSVEYLRIEVVDHGVGIQPKDRERLFEPFFTTKPSGQGTGLGLSVAHGIVQEHGGFIDVWSAPDQGSRFRIFLPS